MKNYTYLLINIVCISIPLIASFYPKRPFYKEWNSFFKANFIVGLFFVVWDVFFTKMGVWGFNTDYLIGINIINLPLEELLFFICIPYACVFTYFALEYLLPQNPIVDHQKLINYAFLSILICLMFMYYDRWYAATTFLLTSCLLIYVIRKGHDMSSIYIAYFAILPFFFMSNGMLTGSGLDKPIVWYNDMENMGIRMFTIPIEDSIYGFLLISLNILFFDYFRGKDRLLS